MKTLSLALALLFFGISVLARRRPQLFDFSGLAFSLEEVTQDLFDAFERDDC